MVSGRSDLVEVELDSGEVVLAEVLSAGGSDVADTGLLRLSQARQALSEVGRWALESVRESLPEPPDRIDVEFGVKLAVKTGRLVAVIAEAGGEASITVRMGWDRATGGGSGSGS